jgi:hypothetical protein
MPAKSTPKPTRPDTVKKGHEWCPRCGEVKVHDLFARNRASKEGTCSLDREPPLRDLNAGESGAGWASTDGGRGGVPMPHS